MWNIISYYYLACPDYFQSPYPKHSLGSPSSRLTLQSANLVIGVAFRRVHLSWQTPHTTKKYSKKQNLFERFASISIVLDPTEIKEIQLYKKKVECLLIDVTQICQILVKGYSVKTVFTPQIPNAKTRKQNVKSAVKCMWMPIV